MRHIITIFIIMELMNIEKITMRETTKNILYLETERMDSGQSNKCIFCQFYFRLQDISRWEHYSYLKTS